MLRKYITYAKLTVHPKLHDTDLEKIALVYADLRRESNVCAQAWASYRLNAVRNSDDVVIMIMIV